MSPSIILFRFGSFLYKKRIPLIPQFITYLNRFLFSVYISSKTKIGKNFKLGYWGLGVVIHEKTVIGNNCLVAQNVTIGRNFKDKSVPVIGNNVYIGAGSIVFGEITIGDNVIIGGNSVINRSIPKDSTVAGNPFKILESNRIKTYVELNVKSKN